MGFILLLLGLMQMNFLLIYVMFVFVFHDLQGFCQFFQPHFYDFTCDCFWQFFYKLHLLWHYQFSLLFSTIFQDFGVSNAIHLFQDNKKAWTSLLLLTVDRWWVAVYIQRRRSRGWVIVGGWGGVGGGRRDEYYFLVF